MPSTAGAASLKRVRWRPTRRSTEPPISPLDEVAAAFGRSPAVRDGLVGARRGPRVLRLCSVFEPPASALAGRAARFHPIGGPSTATRRPICRMACSTRTPAIRCLVLLSMHSDRKAAGHIAKAAGVRALVLDFRRSPEHKFPAQTVDVDRAYGWLLAQGYRPEHIVSSGHSVGGNFGDAELLAGEAIEFAERAQRAGVDVSLHAVPAGQHSFIMGAGRVPEVDEAIERIGRWLRSTLSLATPAAHGRCWDNPPGADGEAC